MSSDINLLIQELTNRLGDHSFYTLKQLTSIGFFGSMSAARNALDEGLIPFLKVSKRRYVIPRQSLIAYLQSNFFFTKKNEF